MSQDVVRDVAEGGVFACEGVRHGDELVQEAVLGGRMVDKEREKAASEPLPEDLFVFIYARKVDVVRNRARSSPKHDALMVQKVDLLYPILGDRARDVSAGQQARNKLGSLGSVFRP